MLSDLEKITSVLWAYRRILIGIGKAQYIAVKVPPTASKHFQNCVQFFDSAEEFGVSVPVLMMACLDSFAPWWCQKIFKRNYPPVNMAVSETTRNRALKNFPRTMATARLDELVGFYVEQLRGYGLSVARGLVQNGICGDDPVMRGRVLKRLQEGSVK